LKLDTPNIPQGNGLYQPPQISRTITISPAVYAAKIKIPSKNPRNYQICLLTTFCKELNVYAGSRHILATVISNRIGSSSGFAGEAVKV
jgi:hypothetical protein